MNLQSLMLFTFPPYILHTPTLLTPHKVLMKQNIKMCSTEHIKYNIKPLDTYTLLYHDYIAYYYLHYSMGVYSLINKY